MSGWKTIKDEKDFPKLVIFANTQRWIDGWSYIGH